MLKYVNTYYYIRLFIFRCALIRHGNLCVKEFTKYDFGSSESGVCSANPENTCKRALCECDQQFAKASAY